MPVTRILMIVDWTSSYGRGIARGAAEFVRQAPDATLVRCELDRSMVIETLRGDAWDGAIAQVSDAEMLALLGAAGRPVINVSSRFPDASYPAIVTDDDAVGVMIGQYLLDLGHRRVGYAGISAHPYSEARRHGLMRVLAEAGASCEVFDAAGEGHRVSMAGMMEWVQLSPKPLALVSCNDMRCRTVARGIVEAGLKVPRDVVLIGVDNDEMLCEMALPLLSSVELSTPLIGCRAAAGLYGWLRGGEAPPRLQLIAPRWVVERESSESLNHLGPDLACAMGFIRKHAADRELSVEELVNHVGLSRRALEMLFRRRIGLSPAEVIRQARLDIARRLIVDTELPMKAIARHSGFADEKQFSKTFTRELGRPPSTYRQQFDFNTKGFQPARAAEM